MKIIERNKTLLKTVFMVAFPIMVQNGFTNFVNLLDNIMVGRLGTEQMSGVAIVNELLFVYNLCILGYSLRSTSARETRKGSGTRSGSSLCWDPSLSAVRFS